MGKAARVPAALGGNGPEGTHHPGVGNAVNAFGSVEETHAQRSSDVILNGAAGPVGVNGDFPAGEPAGTIVTISTDNGGAHDDVFAGTTWGDDADPDEVAREQDRRSQRQAGEHAPLLVDLTRGDAADLWLDKVKAMPVSAQSVAALNRFLGVFDTGDQATSAREELARQQKLLADPAYQARVRGLAQVDKGGSRAAIPELQKALAATPNDAEVLGALGQAYSRAGDRPQALKLFRQALAADKNGYGSGKWQSLIKSTSYWLAIDEGDKALKPGNLALARQKYQQARQLDDSNGDAFIGLGDVAVASKDDAAAEGFYQQALRRDPGNGSALRGLVNIYQRQSPEKALAYLDGLPRSQQAKLRSTLDGLRLDRLKQQAETLAQQQQWQQAAEIYRRAQPMAPDDVWLTYRYAQALRQAGQPQQADALFRQLAQRQHANPQLTYAYALYLSGSDRDRQALAQLNTLPAAQWNDNMRELAQRLKMQATIAHAEGLRAAGDEPAAEAYLRRQPADTRIDLLLADWALARGEYAAALDDYQRVKRREPNNPDAQLGEIEAYVAQGDLDAARQRLKTEPQPQDKAGHPSPHSLNAPPAERIASRNLSGVFLVICVILLVAGYRYIEERQTRARAAAR